MSALLALALAAQPQELLKAELVRVEKGSALVLTFKNAVGRRSLPVVPKGRRISIKLPVAAPAHLTGQREPIGMVRGVQLRGRRITLQLNRDAKTVANEGVVLARRRVWYLRMVDPTASRDLADVLLGTTPNSNSTPESAYQPIDLPPVKISTKDSSETDNKDAEESQTTANALAAVAAAAGGKPIANEQGTTPDGTVTEATDPLAPPPPSSLGQWLRIGAGAALVVFGCLGFWFYRRRQDDHEEAFGLKVISRARLDPKNSIAVLEVGGAVLVVGLSDAGPSLLTRLDEATGTTQDDELGRLRRLVADDPGRRIESWLSHVRHDAPQTPQPAPVQQATAATKPSPAAPPRTQPFTEIEDLKARLAEIRMKVG
ncbi:MAG TPA: hypothetical protein DEB46_14025 [Myxococcales bacterium]|nr:hypothetical protein [Myxococcales bacterium]